AVIGFTSQTYDVPEDQKAQISIEFIRGEATLPVTVRLSTSPTTASEEDFKSREVDVTFQAGETGPKVVEIDLVDDLLVEAMESFNVSLVSTSNPAVSLENPATVNILDNDEAVIGFTQDVYEIIEGSGKARVKVGLLSGETAVPVTV
ncbi:aggregation factor core MAFp3, isoform C, partial, partial [Paramuricea clavata]